MDRIITICATILMTANTFAQTPEQMSYQAVIRDSADELVTNTQVGMQISILQGTANGSAVYVENQTPTTNVNGLVSVEIGAGTTSGDFTNIDWSAGPYFIKTETDPTGGSTYSITGTSQLMSVPYALYAKESGSSLPGPAGQDGEDGVGITSTTDNNDGTFTLNFSDGSVFTTADLTGPQGATGPTGPQGAIGAPGNDGLDGQDGEDGVGIISTTDNNDGTFTLNFSDGSVFTTPDLTGPAGKDGEGITTFQGIDLVGNPAFTGPGDPGSNPVIMFDAQSNSIMPYYSSPGRVNSLFSANVDTTGQFKLGIHNSAFQIEPSARQVGAPSLYDAKFNANIFPGDFYLPAPYPANFGLPDEINRFKYLTIKDSNGQVWFIPAYGGR